MDRIRKNGATSNVVRAKLRRSDTGQGLTGLTSASSGLIISTICDNEASATNYTVAGSTIETISTLGTFATPTATKCRFKEVDATNYPGLYEFQFADARFAVSSAKMLKVSVSGATTLLEREINVQLTAVDVDSATAFVSSIATVTTVTNQLTAAQIATGVWQDTTSGDFTVASSIGKALYVSNVAPGGSGGHMISGSNAGTTTFAAFTVTGAFTVGSMVGSITGNLSGSVGSVTNKVTPIDVDGITHAQAQECILAVMLGKATVSGNTITYFQRDGATASIQITYAAPAGTRTDSSIV